MYLPLAWMREAGIEPEAWLRNPKFNAGVASVVARVLKAADDLYQRAGQGIAALPRDCRPAIQAARLIYAEIGREVQRAGMDSVSRRAVVSSRRKSWLLVAACGAAIQSPTRSRAALTPLPEVQFLLDAIHEAPLAHAVASQKRSLVGRVVWVADLFDRMAERDREMSLQNRPAPRGATNIQAR